jgi:hypothetical protein
LAKDVWRVSPAKSDMTFRRMAATVSFLFKACCTHSLIDGFNALSRHVRFAAIATSNTSPVRMPPSFIAA